MAAEDCVEIVKYPAGFQLFAWRWYFPNRALRWASENGRRFHYWIINLKKGEDRPKLLFARVLEYLWDEPLRRPHAIVVIPPAQSFERLQEYPLCSVADLAAGLGCGIHLKHLLKRVVTIPRAVDNSAMRNIGIQRMSMQVGGRVPARVKSVLLVDDICTSGATLEAGMSLLHEAYPRVELCALVFGKTNRTGSTPFPEEPAFPEPSGASAEDLSRFLAID